MDTSKPTFERTSVCAGSRLSAALDSSSLSSKSDFWFFLGLADSGVLSLLVSPAALSSLSSSASGSSSGWGSSDFLASAAAFLAAES